MPRFNGDTSISSSMDTHYKNQNRQEMISQPSQVRKPSLLTVNFVPKNVNKTVFIRHNSHAFKC